MAYQISSLVPGLLARVRELREAITAGGTTVRTVDDLQSELSIKQDLLDRLLAGAVKVTTRRR